MIGDVLRRSVASDSPRARWLAGALLAVLAWVAYSNSFSVPFLFDDHEAIESNATIKRVSALADVLNPPTTGSGVTGRPVVNLSLALNYAWGKTAVRGYHLFNFGIHVLAGLTLFGVVRRTLSQPILRERYASFAMPYAWSIAVLWTLHPLQTESVTCVIQRTELLVGLFYFLTLYGFLRSVDEPRSRAWPVVMVGACLAGMASKEVMVSAPLIVLLYDRTFVAGSFRESWRQHRPLYLALASTWLLLIYLVATIGGSRGNVAGFGLGVSPFAYALKQCEAILHYLRLTIWPHPLVLDYGESLSVDPIGIWLHALLVIFLLAATALALRFRPVLGFLGAWFFVILAPSSSIVPLLTQTVAEHRMYLPLAAVLIFVLAALEQTLAQRGARALMVAVAALGLITLRRNHDYRSGIAIWQDTVAKSPHNSRAHHNLGVELAKFPERTQEAIASFETAIRCKPTDLLAHYSLAYELAQLPAGHTAAISHYETALRIDPSHINARINLAAELAKDADRAAEAIAHYETVIRLNPRSSMAHNNLAAELAKFPRRSPEAIAHYEYALKLRPDDPEIHYNYANLLVKTNRLPGALDHYDRAVRLRPNFIEAHYALANELANLPDRAADAIAHYQTVLSSNPKHVIAHYNLAVLYANHGYTAEAIRHFEAVLQLNPAADDARQNLNSLNALRK